MIRMLTARLFLPITLLSISHFLSAIAKTHQNLTPWAFQTSMVNNEKVTAASSFYFSPFYDGGRFVSFFIPLFNKGQHYAWWDTGLIVGGSSIGYRYLLQSYYLNQNYFIGGYLAPDWYGGFAVNNQTKYLYRSNIGFELGSSCMGQLTLNIYGFDPWTKKNLLAASRYVWLNLGMTELSKFINAVDTSGYSMKWASIPNAYNFQVSILFAYSGMQKTKIGKLSFSSEKITRIGIGCEFNLRRWAHIECQWIMDKYQRNPIKIVLKLGGMKSHFEKDKFQGRLKRPPQRHIPTYLNVSHLVASSDQDAETVDPLPPYSEDIPLGHAVLESRLT